VLTLTRSVGETIRIGDDIEVHVVEVRGGTVRLGFKAPREVTIHREEVYRQIAEANLLAAQVTADSLGALVAWLIIRWTREGERRAGAILPAPASQRRCNCGECPGCAPVTAQSLLPRFRLHNRDSASAQPPQPRRTPAPGYPPDLQWNGLLHCPSDASQ